MNIVIYKSEILEALKRESSLVSKGAFSNSGESLHNRIYIDEYEFKVVEGAYQEALSILVASTREFLAMEPEITDSYINLSLHKSYPEMREAIKSDIAAFITFRVMASWLSMIYPASAPVYQQAAISTLNNLNTKLYFKAPPMR